MIIRTLAVTAAVGTALVAGSGLAAADAPPVVFHAPIKTLELPLRDYRVLTPLPLRCEEDEPCWDCKVHGNKVCGPNVLESWRWGAPEGSTGSAAVPGWGWRLPQLPRPM